ncbi:hypothetical protein MHC_04925 [Mycoplasma haemocanis str. Illinois]|uniref:Uncharacterized protein n=1 Tax=Mycoplasma haemocanis (strain Illinois) TaxID=1111676 RepID=H6N869_MYCHN|nr:hypothetical protein [Mycoplasma haemocanis]AEW45841.2 hypothetical protein MHC_04925 [Mycoplasma haemocanis str. Illinois]
MTLSMKLAVGLVVASSIGGGSYLGFKLFSTQKETKKFKKIASLISELPDKVLLNKSTEASVKEWKDAWKSYREANKTLQKGKDPWVLDSFSGNYSSGSINDENAPESFRNKCEELSNQEVEGIDDEKYGQVLKYCTKSKTG